MKTILMNTAMTKAILDGRKVQTRRVIKVRTDIDTKAWVQSLIDDYAKYQTDDIIWVREPARVVKYLPDTRMVKAEYLADDEEIVFTLPKRFIHDCNSSMNDFAPKWVYQKQGIPNGCIKEMARIFLKVTNVRVERLQDISGIGIQYEGAPFQCNMIDKFVLTFTECTLNLEWWTKLWQSTAPKGYKWEDNPYVFVYEFERVEIVVS